VTQNQLAFLAMLSHSEGTDRANDPYRVCYGFSHTIVDLSEHPAVETPTHPVEWAGESLASLGPAYAHSISTAAGRYQINKPSWLEGQAVLRLPSFAATCQSDWTLWRIKKAGAQDFVNAGEIEGASAKLCGVWASLPGGDSAQPERSLAYLIDFYTQAGGQPA
jgi:muramidase (phage lysozyme)